MEDARGEIIIRRIVLQTEHLERHIHADKKKYTRFDFKKRSQTRPGDKD